MQGTSSPTNISTKLQRIAKQTQQAPEMIWTTLAHNIDIELLREAYRRTRKGGAPGIDKQTAQDYAQNLEGNLKGLLNRFKIGTYKAPPVRRVYIPKGDQTQGRRPIGIPTFEDKVLQRAVTMVLETVYEQDFLDCSYGFRPGRSAHKALQSLWEGLVKIRGECVLELDIKSYFDTIDPTHLRGFLEERVRDGVLRRAIDKWLRAGVMEDGEVRHPDLGTPQGGVISPLLANIYLHEVLDEWFEHMVKPRLKGEAFLIRYADDAVIAFSQQEDAQRVMEVIGKRFARFGLALHPEKTRLITFRKPRSKSETEGRTFEFLGFTHYWGKSRKGVWVIKRKTAKGRYRRGLKRISEWCKKNRHAKVGWQHEQLVRKLRGHYGYYGITGNQRSLQNFSEEVIKIWRRWLQNRGQKGKMNWERHRQLRQRYPLPPPKIVHSYTSAQRTL